MKKIIPLVSLSLLLAACSSQDKVSMVTPSDLQHHHWELSEIDGTPVAENKFGQVPDIEIGENMNSHGSTGCNSYRGMAEINAETGEFRISKMAMTMKMCQGDAMTTERAVASTLSAWSTIDLNKQSLELSNDEHTLTFVLKDWVQ
ncbi:META domain-containing protein [Vibrio algicola]|uniref:META domain-containing protein n=1 Tax=Vibrio algicola TaxID=2662262 RepID=A0A5Q0TEE4_9VIBR|nr:META domain-containing protein [Vibrio algicola]